MIRTLYGGNVDVKDHCNNVYPLLLCSHNSLWPACRCRGLVSPTNPDSLPRLLPWPVCLPVAFKQK